MTSLEVEEQLLLKSLSTGTVRVGDFNNRGLIRLYKCIQEYPHELVYEFGQLMIMLEEDEIEDKRSYYKWIRGLFSGTSGAGAVDDVSFAAIFLFLNKEAYLPKEEDILDMHLFIKNVEFVL